MNRENPFYTMRRDIIRMQKYVSKLEQTENVKRLAISLDRTREELERLWVETSGPK